MQTLQQLGKTVTIASALLFGQAPATEPQEPATASRTLGKDRERETGTKEGVLLKLGGLKSSADLISAFLESSGSMSTDEKSAWKERAEGIDILSRTVQEALQRKQTPENLQLFEKLIKNNTESLQLYFTERVAKRERTAAGSPLMPTTIGIYDEAGLRGLQAATSVFSAVFERQLKERGREPSSSEKIILDGLGAIRSANNPQELSSNLQPSLEKIVSGLLADRNTNRDALQNDFTNLLSGLKCSNKLAPNMPELRITRTTDSESAIQNWREIVKNLEMDPEVKRRLHPGAKAALIATTLEQFARKGESHFEAVRSGASQLAALCKDSEVEKKAVLESFSKASSIKEMSEIKNGWYVLAQSVVEKF